jgi:putative transposase
MAEPEVEERSPRLKSGTYVVAWGDPCCVNTVARLMRQGGITAKAKRKFRVTTDSNHNRHVAENVLNRRFEPEAPNRAWTAGIT